ncbi:hypothetical protein CJ030_MR1G001677 [Morella rubra]|uniref:Uncharacterized protein n=1 Tax=Morella rubra TaxID=262757 RepID=A0A6A1WT42_9ROSI|nr:hypothetical protein CJ030_MR1G001677 [Morella rubra]
MLLSLVQTTSSTSTTFTSPYESKNANPPSLLPKTLFPDFRTEPTRAFKRLLYLSKRSRTKRIRKSRPTPSITTHASLIEAPVLWAGRLCIFYALLKTGLAGSPSNPLFSELEGGGAGDGESGDLGFSRWLDSVQGKPVHEKSEKLYSHQIFFLKQPVNLVMYGYESISGSRTENILEYQSIPQAILFFCLEGNEEADRRKLVSKWHPTTKGTLKRNYRVPSKTEGRRLLKAIASLLSDDDHFRDATSHKGCQIRRESAHGESVCCNNVRALFDELPTPHLIVEITPFPAGPLTEKDYTKAEKLERVLKSGPSI